MCCTGETYNTLPAAITSSRLAQLGGIFVLEKSVQLSQESIQVFSLAPSLQGTEQELEQEPQRSQQPELKPCRCVKQASTTTISDHFVCCSTSALCIFGHLQNVCFSICFVPVLFASPMTPLHACTQALHTQVLTHAKGADVEELEPPPPPQAIDPGVIKSTSKRWAGCGD